MRPTIALALSGVALAAIPSVAFAQTVYVQNPAPYATPALQYPATPFAKYPRVERTLQFVADPFAAFARNRGQTIPYSDHPLIDAAPNVVNLTSLALFAGSTPGLNALAFGLPPAIRATRVALYGSPVEGPPRDTLLWIVEPSLLRLRNRIRDRRSADSPSEYCR